MANCKILWSTTGYLCLLCLITTSCGKKVERCEDDTNSETCAEFRIVETAGETTYVLAEFSARTDTGTFSDNHLINIDFYPSESLNLCGGTLESRVFYFSARDSEGDLIERDSLDDRPLYVRHNTHTVIEDRDDRLFAIIARIGESAAHYVGADTYSPSGELGVGKTVVNFYAKETNAVFYLIASNEPLTGCAAYSLNEDPESEDES